MVILSTLFLTANASNANYTYVFKLSANASNEQKDKVYKFLNTYSFTSMLNPENQKKFKTNYANYDEAKVYETSATEFEFIKTELAKIDDGIIVYRLPKSLYQMVAYDYFAENIEYKTQKNPFTMTCQYNDGTNYNVNDFCLDKEVKNEFMPICSACDRFMDKDALKKAIQSVNEYTINTFENQISELNYAGCAQLIINKISKNREYDEMKAITGNGVIEDLLRYSSSKSSENIKVKPRIIEHIIKCIEYEKNANDYILYRGDKKNDFDISRVYRQQVCFSDGLFGGFSNDNGGGALRIAYEKESQGEPNALWKIELNRVKLLKWELPVFVPPAHPMVSFLSFGETHHPRTRLVYHSIQNSNPPKVANEFMGIAPGALKIEITPATVIEYYTTTNPRILSVLPPNEFHETEQGIFDKEGATMLETLIKNIQTA